MKKFKMSEIGYVKTHLKSDNLPICGARRGVMNALKFTTQPSEVTCLACYKKIHKATSKSLHKPLAVEPSLPLPYSRQFLS